MSTRNIFLKIAYDGSEFSGWQRQKNALTICGELEKCLEKVCGHPVTLEGCSRTDAGVHALGQTASFKLYSAIPADRIPRAVNLSLGANRAEDAAPIRVVEAREVSEDFHARFSSRGKRYIYRIRAGAEADIFLRNRFYQIGERMDVEAMKQAARHIEGTHDFACFQTAGGTPRESTVRTVFELDLREKLHREYCPDAAEEPRPPQYIDMAIAGDGFLYNMVRIIAGTLAEVGLGKRKAEEMKDIIESGDRRRAGHKAPPQGLYLKEVFY